MNNAELFAKASVSVVQNAHLSLLKSTRKTFETLTPGELINSDEKLGCEKMRHYILQTLDAIIAAQQDIVDGKIPGKG